uniref:UDP-glucose 6-dehydrogenase n=1 Tax=Lotharella globosa TaxID=91324 RepID=A0A7S3YWX2_9EUKA|mmetsp:Transcript_33480/g.64703  ORF Transcript_33480/g.64703 Transcript_33480/m.64703 type:complete len:401 (+) Transcript_33480:62-1264(+)
MLSPKSAESKVVSVAAHPLEKGDMTTLPRAKPGSKGRVSVIGVGRLGLCWALNLERVGYKVLGADIFPRYVDMLNKKSLKSLEPHVSDMLRESKCFRATTDMEATVNYSDVLYILVQTPSTGGNRHYDTSYVARVLNSINKMRVSNKHIVIGCTVMPTYCEKVAKLLISNCRNCTISYNPEFIAQGEIIKGQCYPDIVLIGEGSKEAGDVIEAHARAIALNTPKIQRMSTMSAEICKLSINCFVTTKISYANMIGDICDRTEGADKFDVLKAVGGDSRVGLKYLRPGYGYGGPCFPRDNIALGAYANSVNIDAKISHATDAYNRYHTELQAKDMLDSKKQHFVMTDVAYKEGCPVDIIEESQKLAIAKYLVENGKTVTIADRPAVVQKVKEEFGSIFEYA